MLQVGYTIKFKRDLKLAKKRKKNLSSLLDVMKKIECEKKLDSKYHDHPLSGNWVSHRELHIEPDWLLIYKLVPEEKLVVFVRTGTHSDLFK
jgi:mRNA interferase YafQ